MPWSNPGHLYLAQVFVPLNRFVAKWEERAVLTPIVQISLWYHWATICRHLEDGSILFSLLNCPKSLSLSLQGEGVISLGSLDRYYAYNEWEACGLWLQWYLVPKLMLNSYLFSTQFSICRSKIVFGFADSTLSSERNFISKLALLHLTLVLISRLLRAFISILLSLIILQTMVSGDCDLWPSSAFNSSSTSTLYSA